METIFVVPSINACLSVANTFSVYRQFCWGSQIVMKKQLGAHGLGQGAILQPEEQEGLLPTLRPALPGQLWFQNNVSQALLIVYYFLTVPRFD